MCKDEQSGEERRRIEVDVVDVDLCFAAKDNTARKQRRRDQSTEWTPLFFFTCTGLFVSPSGISELDCATTKTDTAERSISIGRESLQVFFCTRGLAVLPGSTERGSREEKWRSQ